jgi:hypothetical protein
MVLLQSVDREAALPLSIAAKPRCREAALTP